MASQSRSNGSLKTDGRTHARSSASKLLEGIEERFKAGVESDAGGRAAGPLGLLEFGYKYFLTYCEYAPSLFHRELCAELERILKSALTERFACAAPRGTAKTTWVALILLTYCIVYRLKRFAILITSTAALAEGLIRDLKQVLEENEQLAVDFPDACGRGRVWRDKELVTSNGVRVLALGALQRIRGRRHHEHRPDLFILDDLENDEQVRSPEQRDKLSNWLGKAVLKAKGIAKKADFIVIGTILHFDSVLARLLDPKKSPGWRGRKYKSVLQWSDRQDLWQQWQTLYTNWRKPDDQRLADGEAFFLANQKEMLAGTTVLWPEAESYYDLMKLRLDEGPVSFDSEKQNEPIDPATCEFKEEWFQWFDEVLAGDGEVWLVPDQGDRVKLSDCDIFGATDPSMGKQDKHRDPSAIVTIAAYPSRRIDRSGTYRFYYVLDAEIRRRHPHEILQNILKLHRLRRYQRHGIEAIQFQELFADDVQQAAQRDPELQYLRIVKLTPLTDKKLRIQKLSSLVYTGRLRFSRKLTDLYDQFRYFPQAQHDDGPDAVALCIEAIVERGWRLVSADDEGELPKALHPNDQQLRAQVPIAPRGVPDRTCSMCPNFDPRGQCKARLFNVRGEDPACYAFGIVVDLPTFLALGGEYLFTG